MPKLDSFSKNSDELYFDFNQNDRDWRTLILPVDDEEPPLLFLAVTVPKDFLTSQIQESVTIFTGTGVTGLLTLIFTLTLAVYWATRSLRSLTSTEDILRNFSTKILAPPIYRYLTIRNAFWTFGHVRIKTGEPFQKKL